MKDLRGQKVLVSGFHAPNQGTVEGFENAVLTLDDAGRIVGFEPDGDPTGATILPSGWLILPGFVDLHVHAPQYAQLGTALDVPLEEWLQTYTFPLEARFSDLAFAKEVYSALIDDMLALGTTTALHFATVHVPATTLLADLCLAKGQRALIGKVAMDDPDQCPPEYRDPSAEDAIAGTRAVIEYINAMPGNDGMVHPVVTPRFVPSCTDACLSGLGALAQETGTRVQSHVSESDWEHDYVRARTGRSDVEALADHGLMVPHSVFAHGTHLSGSDMDLMIAHQAGVAHCPLSNAYFSGAVFPLRAALERGLNVGLGSDMSGGPVASIWETARMAIASSRLLESGVDAAVAPEARGRGAARIDFRTAFYLATRGGAKALGLPVGSFEPGMKFDAIAIDPKATKGTIRLWPGYDGDLVLEKLLYSTSRANIATVWVDGLRRVG